MYVCTYTNNPPDEIDKSSDHVPGLHKRTGVQNLDVQH